MKMLPAGLSEKYISRTVRDSREISGFEHSSPWLIRSTEVVQVARLRRRASQTVRDSTRKDKMHS
jgi:hypothetical protein